MAAFDLAIAEKVKDSRGMDSKKQAYRLVADPCVGVREIQRVLEGLVHHQQNTNLWELVCPPPGAPSSMIGDLALMVNG